MIYFDLTRDEFVADYFEQKPRHFPGALLDRPVSRDAVQAAALDLARYDIVTIQQQR